jgi:hypothetical protein
MYGDNQSTFLLYLGQWSWADDGGLSGGPRNYGWLRVKYKSSVVLLSVRKHARKRTLAGMKRII